MAILGKPCRVQRLGIALLLTIVAACAYKQTQEDLPPITLQETRSLASGHIKSVVNGGIQSFGYYNQQPAYDVFADHTNVMPAAMNPLEEVISHGFQIQISLGWLLFDRQQGLRDDYVEALAEYAPGWKRIRQHVQNFYLIDEPYWLMGQKNPDGWGFTPEQIYVFLEKAAQEVKRVFPEIPISVVEAYVVREPEVRFPAEIDWIGFDCYESFMRCEGMSIPEYARTLEAKLLPNQRMILVPLASYRTECRNCTPNRNQIRELIDTAEQYYRLALSNPRVVALWPFVGSRYITEGTIWWGADEIPELLNTYRTIGHAIITNIAVGKPVGTADSEALSSASNLNDGDLQTMASSWATKVEYRIDLLESYITNRIRVTFGAFGFDQEGPHIGGWRVSGIAADGQKTILAEGGPPNARYLDISSTGVFHELIVEATSSIGPTGIFEVEVYGHSPS